MKKYLISLSFVTFLISSVFGQLAGDPMADIIMKNTNGSSTFSIEGSLFSSPAFKANQSGYFIPLQYASDDDFEAVYAKMKEQDLFAQEYQGSLIYSMPLESNRDVESNLTFYLKTVGGQQAYLNKDLFQLIVKGNKAFAGKEVVLHPFSFSTSLYQELAVNYYSYKTIASNRKIGLGFGLSLINGVQMTEIQIDQGLFFTSQLGDSVFAAAKATIIGSDQDAHSLFSNNGLGTALNVQFFYQFENKNKLYASIQNLGFISWNKKSMHYDIDKELSFTGLDVFDPNQLLQNTSLELDSLLLAETNSETKSFTQYLSPEISFAYQLHEVFNNASIYTGLVYKIKPYYFPRAFVNLRYQLSESFYFQSGFNLDHYGNFGLSGEIGISMDEKLDFCLGSNHLEGLGLYGYNGQGLYTGLQFSF